MDTNQTATPDRLERVARALLGLALMVSVAYAWASSGV